MRLLPPPTFANRATRGDDAVGQGINAALTLGLFLGLGWVLDRWLGTAPWLMLTCTLLAAVGTFYSLKARYTARMETLEADLAQQRHAAGRPEESIHG